MNCHFTFDRFLSLLQANLSYDVAKVLTLLIFNWSKNKIADVMSMFLMDGWMNWPGFMVLVGYRFVAINSSMYRVFQYVNNVKFSFYEYWILYKCCINFIY